MESYRSFEAIIKMTLLLELNKLAIIKIEKSDMKLPQCEIINIVTRINQYKVNSSNDSRNYRVR